MAGCSCYCSSTPVSRLTFAIRLEMVCASGHKSTTLQAGLAASLNPTYTFGKRTDSGSILRAGKDSSQASSQVTICLQLIINRRDAIEKGVAVELMPSIRIRMERDCIHRLESGLRLHLIILKGFLSILSPSL